MLDSTYYVIGTVAGPHPYPQLVRDFQSIIGREARKQIQEQAGRLPDALVAVCWWVQMQWACSIHS